MKLPFLLFAGLIFTSFPAYAAQVRTNAEAQWSQQVQAQAIDLGISPDIVHAALDSFVPNPQVVELDQKQPESAIAFKNYLRNVVTLNRIEKGAELFRLYKNALRSIEESTGVPPEIVLALWGIESNFGQNMGDYEVVNSLATLAFEGRRAEFFRGELLAALRILDMQRLPPEALRGSWAGAMGQCQFMPSTYLKHAVDTTGNGKPDIWKNDVDIMASIANYLAAEGWQRGLTWGHEIESVGNAQPAASALQSSYVQPDGPEGASYFATDNVRALMKWNKSTYFALAVGLLADRIKANERISSQ